MGGRATGVDAAGALGAGAEATGTAEVVFLAGGAIGGDGSFTGDVADFGAGGGSGADGSWIGAVAVLAVVGGIEEVVDEEGATLPVTGDTGEVASRA